MRKLLLATGFGCTAAMSALTPGSIKQAIHDQGARWTINDLQNSGRWGALVSAMNAGRADWIALAPLLAPGSDAGSAEDLGLSLAFALPRNPRAVLAALDMRNGHVIGADRVCGRPFIEDTEPRNYVPRAIAAVSSIRQPGLLTAKRACLKVLRTNR